jgi:hypothetical protein
VSLLKRALKFTSLRILISVIGAIVVVALAVFTAYRRGIAPPASTPASAPPAAAVAVPALPPQETPTPVVYQSRGRRDPFRQPRVETAQKEPTVNLKLTAIVRGPHSYYALVESESPPGIGYVIRENDVVDSARVLKISKDHVVFEVKTKSAQGKPVTRYVQKQIRTVESR